MSEQPPPSPPDDVRMRLEVHEGQAIYLHARDCSSFCDYACNGRQNHPSLLDAVYILVSDQDDLRARLVATAEAARAERARYVLADAGFKAMNRQNEMLKEALAEAETYAVHTDVGDVHYLGCKGCSLEQTVREALDDGHGAARE